MGEDDVGHCLGGGDHVAAVVTCVVPASSDLFRDGGAVDEGGGGVAGGVGPGPCERGRKLVAAPLEVEESEESGVQLLRRISSRTSNGTESVSSAPPREMPEVVMSVYCPTWR